MKIAALGRGPLGGFGELVGVVSEEIARFVDKCVVFGPVQIPKIRLGFPCFKMDIPDILPMCTIDTDTCIADVFGGGIFWFARVRVDIVKAVISDWRFLIGRGPAGGFEDLVIVFPRDILRTIAMM